MYYREFNRSYKFNSLWRKNCSQSNDLCKSTHKSINTFTVLKYFKMDNASHKSLYKLMYKVEILYCLTNT